MARKRLATIPWRAMHAILVLLVTAAVVLVLASEPNAPIPFRPTPIVGTAYYVSPKGSDSSSGTSRTSPWRTVARVNRASLRPGDGVRFLGGARYSDDALLPQSSGSASAPIVFESYGAGKARIPKGVWFDGHDHLAFQQLAIGGGPNDGIRGTGSDITVQGCSIAHVSVGIMATGSNWTIRSNTIDSTRDSGMTLQGDRHRIENNLIAATGLDRGISYGKHGIYLKVTHATVVGNAITHFAQDGVSVRYRDSVVEHNKISNGAIGIAWFQYDPVGGTSYWRFNDISDTTAAGIYVSPGDQSGATRESFVIVGNALGRSKGSHLDLRRTSGTYSVRHNTHR